MFGILLGTLPVKITGSLIAKSDAFDIVNKLDKTHAVRFNNLTDVIRKNSDGTEYTSARDFGELLVYCKFANYIPLLQYALEH